MKKQCMLIFLLFLVGFVKSAGQVSRSVTTCDPDLKLYPVLWQQKAAEYRALCYQAFNIATVRLQEIALQSKIQRKMAIVTDLDETILDNSYLYAQLILDGKVYSEPEWKKWTNQSKATAVPGAVQFLQFAASKGFTLFYISNRDTSEISSTVKNLIDLKIPDADRSHMLFMSNTSSKEERRQHVAEKYEIVMLLGDNLNDFMDIFRGKTIDERSEAADSQIAEWGKKFIVLPNSNYGQWEDALFNYIRKYTSQQKDSILLRSLVGY
jgi:5'-nucleotidase (lipoprotein e(P4) family)